MRTSVKRNDILKTASRLFNQYGFKAIGIDRIVLESNIAKMTMYHHFNSKEEIILEVLDDFNQSLKNSILRPISESRSSSQMKIKKLVNMYEAWFLSEDFYGCPFHKAMAEFPEREHPVHQKIQDHQRLLMDFLIPLVDSKSKASQILLVLEGSIINAKISRDTKASNDAWKIISLIIKKKSCNEMP